ncbi:MAG: patatin-like phospholipase family protein [Propioniciclava sp.]|uniref:hypothetical protein n=1 Tax=Propioniciclava sp. TaxID=2038686 RepID=UPI0039E69292
MKAPLDPCDLVMKGGITSGIVYPKLVTTLAKRYRFGSIGGASAGAIAAALTAAAEHQRGRAFAGETPHRDGPVGFDRLEGLPTELGGVLQGLFVARTDLTEHLGALMDVVDLPTWPAKLRAVVGRVARAVPGPFWLGVLGSLALGTLAGIALATTGANAWLAGIVGLALAGLAAVIGLALAVVTFVRVGIERMDDNGFGLVRGLSNPGETPGSALTEWLADTLDSVADLPAGEVLTYGHLWGAEASAVWERLGLETLAAVIDPAKLDEFAPDVDLQMMTTCVSLRRPYTFPLRTRIFHWCPDCWADYYPPRVLTHLREHSAPAEAQYKHVNDEQVLIPAICPAHPRTELRSLPSAPSMPLIVGVRISLSFPGLISAVPMAIIDHWRAQPHWAYAQVWFSDGGLTSNFPLEFFDSPMPRHPTFGITLEERHPDFPDQGAYRPADNHSGILGRVRTVDGTVSFLTSLVGVLTDWRDALTIPAAGNRDRVVELRLPTHAGGLHLAMPADVIEEVAELGAEGAEQLAQFDWDNHRWIRYRTATTGLGDLMHGMRRAAGQYVDLVNSAEPPSYPVGRPADDRAASKALLDAANTLADLGNPAHTGSVPSPRRQFTATPKA